MMVKDVAIQGYLENLVGKDGLEMIERVSADELTDEKIAEETGSNLNTVRRTLYILYENRLANYRRERDKDSGWLTYLWQVDLSDITRNIDDEAQKLVRRLEARLDFEGQNVCYTCESGCGRFLFETASDYDFICPVCRASLSHQDSTILIEALKGKLDQLKSVFKQSSKL
jgi:transcription initiation factor TFIIE subunit alpha